MHETGPLMRAAALAIFAGAALPASACDGVSISGARALEFGALAVKPRRSGFVEVAANGRPATSAEAISFRGVPAAGEFTVTGPAGRTVVIEATALEVPAERAASAALSELIFRFPGGTRRLPASGSHVEVALPERSRGHGVASVRISVGAVMRIRAVERPVDLDIAVSLSCVDLR